jgi:hypothetical protein
MPRASRGCIVSARGFAEWSRQGSVSGMLSPRSPLERSQPASLHGRYIRGEYSIIAVISGPLRLPFTAPSRNTSFACLSHNYRGCSRSFSQGLRAFLVVDKVVHGKDHVSGAPSLPFLDRLHLFEARLPSLTLLVRMSFDD